MAQQVGLRISARATHDDGSLGGGGKGNRDGEEGCVLCEAERQLNRNKDSLFEVIMRKLVVYKNEYSTC